jgi:hypothetical protein
MATQTISTVGDIPEFLERLLHSALKNNQKAGLIPRGYC